MRQYESTPSANPVLSPRPPSSGSLGYTSASASSVHRGSTPSQQCSRNPSFPFHGSGYVASPQLKKSVSAWAAELPMYPPARDTPTTAPKRKASYVQQPAPPQPGLKYFEAGQGQVEPFAPDTAMAQLRSKAYSRHTAKRERDGRASAGASLFCTDIGSQRREAERAKTLKMFNEGCSHFQRQKDKREGWVREQRLFVLRTRKHEAACVVQRAWRNTRSKQSLLRQRVWKEVGGMRVMQEERQLRASVVSHEQVLRQGIEETYRHRPISMTEMHNIVASSRNELLAATGVQDYDPASLIEDILEDAANTMLTSRIAVMFDTSSTKEYTAQFRKHKLEQKERTRQLYLRGDPEAAGELLREMNLRSTRYENQAKTEHTDLIKLLARSC